MSTDMKIRVFDYASGKLKRTYDESLVSYQQRAAAEGGGTSGMGFGRMMAIEKELESSPEALRLCNLTFDESGHFLVFGSAVGIKILNIVTNRVVRTLGGNESGERFTGLALYQGTPKVDMQYLLSLKNSAAQTKTVDETEKSTVPDPTVYCCSLKKRRFYCFSSREPDESEQPRDVLNEKPTEDERLSTFASSASRGLPREATMRTSRGDIHIKLFADDCPRTVENFTTHAKNKYYDNVIFHRVIKGFMIQVMN
jgi:peptidylprolyl isomerase domain and WD repeat-containing protein 1